MNNEECWACGCDVCVCAEISARYATVLIESAVKAEREACARVLEAISNAPDKAGLEEKE